MKILVTGASGTISNYLIKELLQHNHHVVGIDNFSKYGKIKRNYDQHPNYKLIDDDVKNTKLLSDLLKNCDQIVAMAAKVGGIGYFHKYAYDLISENEKITCSTFDAAINAYKNYKLQKINVISSSMVFENSISFPHSEGDQFNSKPPSSTYGFQKLSTEYFAKGAWEQYGLPFTIIRPFNCVGIGEQRAINDKDVESGNVQLAMSHVVPDLIQKILKGQNPLRILGNGNQIRHFTYGGDLAYGIRLCIESKNSYNEDFNISNNQSTSIIDLARLIWEKIKPEEEFKYISEEQLFKYDVPKRIPNTDKAKNILGFEAKTSLSEILDIMIPWIKEQINKGTI